VTQCHKHYNSYIPTVPRCQGCDMYRERLGSTQKTPTQRSATAKLARQKFTTLRILRCSRMTAITNTLPSNHISSRWWPGVTSSPSIIQRSLHSDALHDYLIPLGPVLRLIPLESAVRGNSSATAAASALAHK